MKILVTGSTGVIGGVLLPYLKKSGHEVIGLDKKSSADGPNYIVDISAEKELKRAFDDMGKMGKLDAVIHLAAESDENAGWPSVLNNNIIGTTNVYSQALEHGVKRIIFASSVHATGGYGGLGTKLIEKNFVPITTRLPVRPDGFYGTSKVFGEALARQFFDLYAMESICLRLSGFEADDNPIGKGDSLMKAWLSHRDFLSLIDCCLATSIGFGIYYAMSNNRGSAWSISETMKELGWAPKDDAFALLIKKKR